MTGSFCGKLMTLSALMSALSFQAYAKLVDTVPDFTDLPGSNRIESFNGRSGVTGILANIIEKGIDITAMLAVIALCIVGLMFITASGDPEKAKKATKYGAIILLGIAVALGAYAIIAIIDKIPNSFRFF